jgi:hypothetical protein
MKQKLKLLLLFICTLNVWQVNAQITYPNAQNWECGLDLNKMSQLVSDTGFANRMARYNYALANPGNQPQAGAPYIVPVVFHVIETGSVTAVSYAQIQWQLARINAAFKNQMTAFNGQPQGPRSVDTQIEFRLACVAQNCNMGWSNINQPGVMRYLNVTDPNVLNQGVLTASTFTSMLAITHPTTCAAPFPFANYLNIWCVPNITSASTGTVIGFGTFPWMNVGIDGVVMRLDAIGNASYPTNFPLNGQWDKGSILVHEFGHYLGLYHTFESAPTLTLGAGCYGTGAVAGDALTEGDLLLDTPPTHIIGDIGTVTSVNSCNETNFPYGGTMAPDVNDQIENYMCYSDDDKLNTFTQHQANRMVGAFTNTLYPNRTNLNSITNLSVTTAVNPNSCAANTGLLTGIFNYSVAPGSSCTNIIIQFTNPTSLGFTATGYNWNFGDGLSGAGASPLHTYAVSSPTTFIATCTATNSSGSITYTSVVNANFNVSISGQSGKTVCRGKEQTIYIAFGAGVPSVNLTDGTTQYLVYNTMDLSVPEVVPYTFVANTSASYSLVPATCGTVNLGVATFSVIDCCNSLINNGDFSSGSTGITTQLATPIITVATSCYGSYSVLNPTSSSITSIIPVLTGMSNITGDAMLVDGFQCTTSTVVPNTPAGCNLPATPLVYRQTISGLKSNTTYYYSFKLSENFNAGVFCPLNFQTRIYNSSLTILPTQTLQPTIYQASTNPNSHVDYVVFTYTFTTSASTLIPASSFSVDINQIKHFGGVGWDFLLDNITLNEMNASVQAIGSNSICPTQTTALSVAANCGNSLSNYVYAWTPTISLSCSTCTNPIASPSTTTTYTLLASPTSTGSPVITSMVTVYVNPLPIITTTASPLFICPSQNSTLTASGASTYTWNTGATTNTAVVTPTVTTIYTVTGRSTLGCISSNTVSVNVYTISPQVTITSNTNIICSGTTTLTASGAASFTWSPGGATTTTLAVSPSVATIYTVSAIYGTGCSPSTNTTLVNPVVSTLCCSVPTGTIGTSLTSTVYPAAGSFTNTSAIINVQGVVNFTANTSYTGYTFRMAPGALLRVDPNKTLTLTNCKMFSCTELWDGILLREDDLNFGNLVLNNTTIEDMYNGIVVDYDNHTINSSSPSGSITINASKLNKNYISVQMRNSSGMSSGIGNYPFSITSSTISSATSTTSPGSSLKPSSTYTYAYNTITNGSTGASAPYINFPRAFTGIQLSNLGYLCSVNIGSRTSSTLTNTFNNLDFGVNGTEVYTKVYNNYFKNITGSVKSLDPSPLGPPPAQGPGEIGIAVCITQTTTANYNTCIVGANPTLPTITNPYPDGNLFEDCNRGVKTNNNRYVTVLGNVFTTTTTSIPVSTSSGYPPMFVINPNTYYYYTGQNAVWSSALGTKADLSYNLISNHNTGIYDSHSINPTISGTVIVQGNDISAPASTGYCKQAIQIDQAGGTNIPTDQAYIYNNRLINVYRGVVSNGVLSGLLIKGNTINVEGVAKTLNYTAASQRTGVALTGCQYASIKGNSFTQTGSMPTTTVTALAINGVYLKNSPYGKTECNTATNLGRCFVFEGTCDNSWKVNNMSNSYIGMEIRVLGRIGIQGAPTGAPAPNLSANTWATITRETNILNSANNNTISPLYVLAGAGTQPTLNFGTAGHSYTTAANMGIRVATGTSYTCNSGSAQRTSGDDNTVNGNNKKTNGVAEDSLTDYISLAQSDENTYDAFTDEFIYQNKQLVYKLMAADSLQVADGSTLDNFYQANQNTAIAQLTEVQKAINNDDIHLANSANASVSPSNVVEYKHQRANELVLKYLADRFYVYADAEKQDLYNYANECVIKGYYVIQARNIINIITNQVIEYNDDCEAQASSQRKAKVQATGISNTSTFNLFPNPNNGTMQLDYNLGGYAKAEFKLFDITGKLISIKNMAENEGSILITERNLSNGVYFYHILVGEKTIKTDKIVIIK